MKSANISEIDFVSQALQRVLRGESLDEDTLYSLADIDSPEGRQALLDAAAAITQRFCSRRFSSCSIVNARSGRCSENCKWCAQSVHFDTHCDTYELVDTNQALDLARYNAAKGIGRFSLVTSGRAAHSRALDAICDILTKAGHCGIDTCASLGLLNEDELRRLRQAGASRYHCNMETAPSYFPTLCSTHSQDDKLATIEAARRAGLRICSGGIIGMGESRRQRMEFAIFLRQVDPDSIPINILAPIPGTPLQDIELISEADVLNAVALFRFAHPSKELRFAGGRKRLSEASLLEAFRVGINGAIMGDLLTTTGSTIDRDKELIHSAGYEF